MTRALVVFESMYGNTRAVAQAIADGLSMDLDVTIMEVGAAPTVIGNEFDLLVVGSPTHAFGMSRTRTREDAAKRATQPLVSRGIGIREWLDGVQADSGHMVAAAFDTMLDSPRWIRLFGGAARRIEKRLRRLGFRIVAPRENFWVAESAGPLLDGEEERARCWGADLAATVRVHTRERIAS